MNNDGCVAESQWADCVLVLALKLCRLLQVWESQSLASFPGKNEVRCFSFHCVIIKVTVDAYVSCLYFFPVCLVGKHNELSL